MKNYGKSVLSEIIDDFVVYRNLDPIDSRLPGFSTIQQQKLVKSGIPRKTDIGYAQVLKFILEQARKLSLPKETLRRLICIGDTRMNDGTAFSNLCDVSSWRGLCFIGSENNKPLDIKLEQTGKNCKLFLSNRWSALEDFKEFCNKQDFPIDQNTVILIDMDKTMLGARGRNAHVIDQARVEGVKETVAKYLKDDFNGKTFRNAYDYLNQPEFHPFTTDNQDYLAYICLILGSGFLELGELIRTIQSGKLNNFHSFIETIEKNKKKLAEPLKNIHNSIYKNVQAGDPTPFKEFRRTEYLTTIKCMGQYPDDTDIRTLLDNEILITQEVRSIALEWKNLGALIFGISDKPDEASIPTIQLKEKGFAPIHKTPTHIAGY